MRHDRTGSDGAVVADGYAGQDGHVAADPHAITDRHRFCPFPARVAFCRARAVTCTIDLHVRSQETVIADGQYRQPEVSKEPFSDTDMLSIIAVERLHDKRIFIRLTEQVTQHLVSCCKIGR